MLKVPGKKTEAMRQAPASVKCHIIIDGEAIKWPSRVAIVGDGKNPKRQHQEAGFIACCCKCCCVLQMCVFIVSNIEYVSKHCICLKVLQCQTLLLHLSCPSSAAGDLSLTTTMACVKCSTHLSTMMPSTSWRGRRNQVPKDQNPSCVKLLCEVVV